MPFDSPVHPPEPDSVSEAVFAHILSLEIVGLMLLPMETQAVLTSELEARVRTTSIVRLSLSQGKLLLRMTVMGLTLAFFGEADLPLRSAIEIAEALANLSHLPLRMGLHSGTVRREKDTQGLESAHGEGIVRAQRIMACGDKGHILLSSEIVDRLAKSPLWARYWSQYLKDLGLHELDTGERFHFYALHYKHLGNPETPICLSREVVGQVPAHMLFMDVVGSAALKGSRQLRMYHEVQQLVASTTDYQRSRANNQVLCRSTGDGMLVVFFDELLAPLRCATEIARKLKTESSLKLRMGIHTGYVNRVQNINGEEDVSGDDVVTAARVMDCGDADHILVSSALGHALAKTPPWSRCLHYIGQFRPANKKEVVDLYNWYEKDIGNSHRPRKAAQGATWEKPTQEETQRRQSQTLSRVAEEAQEQRVRERSYVALVIATLMLLVCGLGYAFSASLRDRGISVFPHHTEAPGQHTEATEEVTPSSPDRQEQKDNHLQSQSSLSSATNGVSHPSRPPSIGPSNEPDKPEDRDTPSSGTASPKPTETTNEEAPFVRIGAKGDQIECTFQIPADGQGKRRIEITPIYLNASRSEAPLVAEIGDESQPFSFSISPEKQRLHIVFSWENDRTKTWECEIDPGKDAKEIRCELKPD